MDIATVCLWTYWHPTGAGLQCKVSKLTLRPPLYSGYLSPYECDAVRRTFVHSLHAMPLLPAFFVPMLPVVILFTCFNFNCFYYWKQ